MKEVLIILPNQLFESNDALQKNIPIYLVEEYMFFNQYNFHKQKLVFQRASMKNYENYLNDNSYNVDELASIFLDIGQDIPRGTHNQKYNGEGGTYVVVSEGVIKEDKGINYLKDAFETYLAGGDTFTNKPGKTETVKFKNDGSLIPKKKFEAALQLLPTTVKVDVYSVNFKKVGDNIVGTFKIK